MEQQKNNKLKTLFKKNWKYILTLLLFLFIVLFLITSKNKDSQKPRPISTPVSNNTANYQGVEPGKSTIEELNKVLGSPLETETTKESNTLYYKTSNQYINHEVQIKENIVGIIKEKIIFGDETNADTIREQYGTAPFVLYEEAPSSVFDLYIYPENGIAFVGHIDGTLLEIWYFEQTHIDDFISNWGQGYSRNEYKGKVRY